MNEYFWSGLCLGSTFMVAVYCFNLFINGKNRPLSERLIDRLHRFAMFATACALAADNALVQYRHLVENHKARYVQQQEAANA